MFLWQSSTHKMRELKTLEDSLQARSDALTKKESDLQALEAQLKSRQQKLEMDEKRVAAAVTAAATAAAAAAVPKHRADYQYSMPTSSTHRDDNTDTAEENTTNRRMSIQMSDHDDSVDVPASSECGVAVPPATRRSSQTSSSTAPFQIFADGTLPSKPHTRVASSGAVVKDKENMFQYQYQQPAAAFKYDSSKPIQNNFRQPPPPLPFKKFQHLKEEGKGRQDRDGGSATKKQRPPGYNGYGGVGGLTDGNVRGNGPMLRKFESL